MNPSGPPPLKITENARASNTHTSDTRVTPRIAAVRLMWKWHSAAMIKIAPIANTNHGMFTPVMVFTASLAKYAGSVDTAVRLVRIGLRSWPATMPSVVSLALLSHLGNRRTHADNTMRHV